MKLIYCVLSIIALALLSGCSSSFTTGTAKLSRESVNRSIVDGKSTKAEVRAMLGEPQSQSTSEMGGFFTETWVYNKTFFRDMADSKGIGYAVLVGFANPYATGYDRVEVSMLLVTFDGTGRVRRHMFTTSAHGMI